MSGTAAVLASVSVWSRVSCYFCMGLVFAAVYVSVSSIELLIVSVLVRGSVSSFRHICFIEHDCTDAADSEIVSVNFVCSLEAAAISTFFYRKVVSF